MKLTATGLDGAFIVDPQHYRDDRGFLARAFCKREFAEHGLHADVAQCNVSHNPRKGTLRGMHFQTPPHEEIKLVRCTRGSIVDVILDLRPDSKTYKRWVAVELAAGTTRMLYIPAGFAHGFQTLEDDVEVFYQMSTFYHAPAASGVRWNDPAFGIRWPIDPPTILSPRDQAFPDFPD